MTAAHPAQVSCLQCGVPIRPPREYCCVGCHLAASFNAPGARQEGDGFLARIMLAALFAVGVMACSLANYSSLLDTSGDETAQAFFGLYRHAALCLSLGVVWALLLPMLRAVTETRRWFSADAFVLLGAVAAFAASVWSTWTGRGEVYFETAAMITVLMGVGRWLDARARTRARDVLNRVSSTWVVEAKRLRSDDSEERVALGELRRGDRVRLHPGERVEFQAQVHEGACFVDRSASNGESEPVRVAAGEPLLVGDVLVDGSLVVDVAEDVDADSSSARWRQFVDGFIASKSGTLGLADRLVGWLFPVVCVAAVAAFVLNGGFEQPAAAAFAALSVLLVACPCALGIATPLVYWQASARTWERGMILRHGAVLELLARTRRVIFDKTGTLTLRQPRVTRIAAVDPRAALRVAAALELGSEHPLGDAIRRAWFEGAEGERLPRVDDFRTLPGRGVEALIDGEHYRLEQVREAGADERTASRLLRGDEELARFEFESDLRPSAKPAVERLDV